VGFEIDEAPGSSCLLQLESPSGVGPQRGARPLERATHRFPLRLGRCGIAGPDPGIFAPRRRRSGPQSLGGGAPPIRGLCSGGLKTIDRVFSVGGGSPLCDCKRCVCLRLLECSASLSSALKEPASGVVSDRSPPLGAHWKRSPHSLTPQHMPRPGFGLSQRRASGAPETGPSPPAGSRAGVSVLLLSFPFALTTWAVSPGWVSSRKCWGARDLSRGVTNGTVSAWLILRTTL